MTTTIAKTDLDSTAADIQSASLPAVRVSADLAPLSGPMLTEEEIANRASDLVIGDGDSIASFSDEIEGALRGFGSEALSKAKAADHPEVIRLLRNAQITARKLNPTKLLGPARLIKRVVLSVFGAAGSLYEDVRDRMTTVEDELAKQEAAFMERGREVEADARDMNSLYDANDRQHRAAILAVAAGRRVLIEARGTVTDRMQYELDNATPDERALTEQRAARVKRWCDELEFGIGQWESVRTNCVRASREIELLRSASTLMARTIRSVGGALFPECRKQLAVALAVDRLGTATSASLGIQKAVNEMTVRTSKKLALQLPKTVRAATMPIYEIKTITESAKAFTTGMAAAEREYVAALDRVRRATPELERIEREMTLAVRSPATRAIGLDKAHI